MWLTPITPPASYHLAKLTETWRNAEASVCKAYAKHMFTLLSPRAIQISLKCFYAWNWPENGTFTEDAAGARLCHSLCIMSKSEMLAVRACVPVRECLFMRLWVDVLLLSFFVANSLPFAPLDFIRWFHLPNLSNLWFIASPACVLFLVTRRDVITLRLCHVLSAPLAFSIHRERWN